MEVPEAIRRPSVDVEPLLAEIVHLLHYLGDGVLADPGDGDVIIAPAGGDAEGDTSERLARRSVPEGVETVEEIHWVSPRGLGATRGTPVSG